MFNFTWILLVYRGKKRPVSIFLYVYSASHSISAIDLEISEVRVRKIPIPENSTRKWFIEFDGFNSWIINSDLGNGYMTVTHILIIIS